MVSNNFLLCSLTTQLQSIFLDTFLFDVYVCEPSFLSKMIRPMTQLESCRKDRWCGEDRVVLLRVTVVECKTPSSSILNFTGGSSHGRPHRMSMKNDRMQKVSVLDLDLLSNQYIALLSLLPQPAISSIFCFLHISAVGGLSFQQPTNHLI